MPPLPPDEETVDDQVQDTPPEIAPPMQADVPQAITQNSFVQQIEPPPPENPSFDRSAIVIPPGVHVWSNGIALIDISKLDQKPVPILRAQATYPYDLQHEGITGQALIEFIVDAQGNVRNPFVVSSSRHDFDEAALKAIVKWKFKPGRKNGHAVNTSRVQQPFEFNAPNSDD
jgi:protein TonB